MFQVGLSNQAEKFIESGAISEEKLLNLFDKFIDLIDGADVNIDVIKLKGKWRGFYRLRFGAIRIIFKVNFEKHYIYVKRIDFRKDTYRR